MAREQAKQVEIEADGRSKATLVIARNDAEAVKVRFCWVPTLVHILDQD